MLEILEAPSSSGMSEGGEDKSEDSEEYDEDDSLACDDRLKASRLHPKHRKHLRQMRAKFGGRGEGKTRGADIKTRDWYEVVEELTVFLR